MTGKLPQARHWPTRPSIRSHCSPEAPTLWRHLCSSVSFRVVITGVIRRSVPALLVRIPSTVIVAASKPAAGIVFLDEER